jgi:tRNA (guanine-N7-)-methyltransferase
MAESDPVRIEAYRAEVERRRVAIRDFAATLSRQPGQELVWELGCGHGHFLNAYAEAHPQKICVGIDLVGERVERSVRKRDRNRLGNLHFLRAEARLFLAEWPADLLFSTVFILFPDPWPKARHHKHRILQPEFLTTLAGRCREGASLHFRTDYRPYFEEAHQTLTKHPRWEVSNEPWPFPFETVFQSRALRHDSVSARSRPSH